jgi:pSer/pThr/pTyr-binding forkhead associated (FHA) protein
VNSPRQANQVTLTVLQGADRGRVFRGLQPPITIGREEGNSIQLNDERISRCHLKIQDDNSCLVMTDLDSTNGTKVNGQECHLRILRHGDLIAVGRSVLLVGSQEEIAARIAMLRKDKEDEHGTASPGEASSSSDAEPNIGEFPTAGVVALTLGAEEPPPVPSGLSPRQAAELNEILDYLHGKIQRLVDSARVIDDSDSVALSSSNWQRLLDVQMRLSSMLRQISDPESL